MDNHVIYVMDYHQDILDYIIKSSIKMLWIISIKSNPNLHFNRKP